MQNYLFLWKIFAQLAGNRYAKRRMDSDILLPNFYLTYMLVSYGGKKIISLLNGKKGNNVELNNLGFSLPTVKSVRNRLPKLDGRLGLNNMDTKRVIAGIPLEDRKNKNFHLSIDEAALTFGSAYRNGMLYGFEEIVYQKDVKNFVPNLGT
eukprot:TRINITY_DN454_c0_g1_i1.p1 TRINITY_DN454_c0_g1~~TRINITY_DN454_c0_g1_i1.p1  ORF type:complete len:151 (+),score=38.70 TRINITY_DN454_c0_g1_i1:428-880(+)